MTFGRTVFTYLCLPAFSLATAQARSAAVQPIEVNFAAQVNGEPFACGKTYAGVGSNKVSWQPQDFRFYVSDMALLRADGSKIPVTFVADDTWQTKDVALLDFEDRSGSCQNGTPATRTVVRGTVPSDAEAVGIAFRLAVPFDLNHGDASTQAPPLDQAGMFWGWQMGYKFLSLEGRVNDGLAHTVHVGSTGCNMATPNKVTGCSARNEAMVTFAKFDLKTQRITADVGALLADSAVGRIAGICPQVSAKTPAPAATAVAKTANGPNGCMSEHDNANCAPIFNRLGLPFAGKAAATNQQFFKVQ